MAYDGTNITVVGGPTAKAHYDQVFDNTVALKEGLIMHDKIGIGTTPVPHGGIGLGIFAIEGPDSDVDGPHVQITTDSDDYPLFHLRSWAHDSISMGFDCYHDGANFVSSDAGSNFLITKSGDLLKFFTDTGTNPGDNLSVITLGCWNTAGHWGIGTTAVDASALLELDSTTGALYLGRMTTGQGNALAAQNGMLFYDVTLNKFRGYENGAWANLI